MAFFEIILQQMQKPEPLSGGSGIIYLAEMKTMAL